MNYVIDVNNLRKYYNAHLAIKNLTLQIKHQVIGGIVGPNGSGKTSLINILTGIYPPSSGNVKILGMSYLDNDVKIKIDLGFVSEDCSLFEHLRGEEQLYFIARMYGLKKNLAKQRIDELFNIFDLAQFRSAFVHEYSKGMKKKLAFMCAIIHNPKILFLDELFDGLDPISSKQIKEILKRFNKKGGTVFLTSHNLPLIENLCTQIAIIDKGELIFNGPKSSIRNYFKQHKISDHNSNLDDLFHRLVAPDRPESKLSWL